ncbi:class I lanthipeptide [Flammeovirga aprica]|uniref:class I lanthipeptide n=1 Tax=Flammeovirga aprica TaxID=29528 RepID=UPI00197E0907
MKKSKKIQIKKSIISNLSKEEQNRIEGGYWTHTCWTRVWTECICGNNPGSRY